MLFRLRLEELQNFLRHFIVCRQRVEVRTRRSRGDWLFIFLCVKRAMRLRLRKIERRWLGWKRETIAIFKRRDIFEALLACVADFEKVGFEERDTVREELGQRSVKVFTERRIQRVLENVCKLSGDLGETRKAVACGSSAQSVCRNIQPLQVFAIRLE